jgi:hypothetical protein
MSKDFTDLPGLAQVTASTHVAMLETALPMRLAAYFVVGSAALGDFVTGRSDVDFIAVMHNAPTPAETRMLARIHRAMRGRPMLAEPDGWYVPAEGPAGNADALSACERFNGGKHLGGQRFDLNSPDGWVLRQYGVRAIGEGAALGYQVDWEALLAGIMQNLDAYWRRWVRESRGITQKALALLVSPGAAEWGVLGISRLYYTFREHNIISKAGAGGYALEHLPEQWHGVIREALMIRCGEAPRLKPSLLRRRETLAFMDFMLEECARAYRSGEKNG